MSRGRSAAKQWEGQGKGEPGVPALPEGVAILRMLLNWQVPKDSSAPPSHLTFLFRTAPSPSPPASFSTCLFPSFIEM